MNKFRCFIASRNPTKVDSMREALIDSFGSAWSGQMEGISVSSDVPAQPVGDQETLQGAVNRIANLRALLQQQQLPSDTPDLVTLLAAVEGGLSRPLEALHHPYAECFAWVRVETYCGGRAGQSRSCSFMIPPRLAALVFEEGLELGHADDRLFERTNSKAEDGTVGVLTRGLVDRKAYYKQPAVLSLIPFINVNHLFSASIQN